jgi:outer membrane lipoprotein-sorting protein
MKSLIIAMIFAITLILSLEVNVTKARTYPSSSKVSKMLSSFQSFSHNKEGSSKSTQNQHEVVASLKHIPPSRPNPTQNK